DEFAANLLDGLALGVRELSEAAIDPGRSHLDHRQSADLRPETTDRNARNVEVVERPLRLRAPDGIVADLDPAEAVLLVAHIGIDLDRHWSRPTLMRKYLGQERLSPVASGTVEEFLLGRVFNDLARIH